MNYQKPSDNKPMHTWTCPMMQALELDDPPRFLEVEGKRLELKTVNGINRYELARNQPKTRSAQQS